MTPQETIEGWEEEKAKGYEYAKVCFEAAPNSSEEFIKNCLKLAEKNATMMHRAFEKGMEGYLEEHLRRKENR